MKKISQYPLSVKGVYRHFVLEIITNLYSLPRTGWVDRGVKNPETVGKHSDDLVTKAKQLFPEIIDLARMLKVHDWVEQVKGVGDMRTDPNCPSDHKFTLEEKRAIEIKAMKELCAKLGPFGKSIFKLWLEYEEGKTRRAKIAYQLDKLDAIEKAAIYQKNGEPVDAWEFINYSGTKVTEPRLKKILNETIVSLEI